MIAANDNEKYCVVGAGSSGLAVAKNFLAAGIGFEVIEPNDDVGGVWYSGSPTSSVYRSAHLISSKPLTEYSDFPMPESYPHYPSRQQAWEYLRSYADHFNLYEHIRFGRAVQCAVPTDDGRSWNIRFDDGSARRFRGLVISHGHNWDPNWPRIPGEFAGVSLHSAQYKTPDVLRDRRVLVIGAGNSGCDIAVESAQNAAMTYHSTRRGYHYLPKFLFGLPIDQCGELMLRLRLPLWMRRMISRLAVRVALGPPRRAGLPAPDHRLFETHPILNSQLYYHLGHGAIVPKPDVQEFCGDEVVFQDGSREKVDVVVFATGFKNSFPFIDQRYLNWKDGRPELFMNIFHPEKDNLFVVGMIQPDSGQWGLVDCQSQLVARIIQLQDSGDPAAVQFRQRLKKAPPDLSAGIRYVNSPRHMLEVEHFSYRRQLQKMIAKLS
ncbi:MAG: NAD(P)-binding domain-containing protein [Pirellulales bacterium]|nr:NAD(P)-binding domain-containing protein [Pirellulales bacterium]